MQKVTNEKDELGIKPNISHLLKDKTCYRSTPSCLPYKDLTGIFPNHDDKYDCNCQV